MSLSVQYGNMTEREAAQMNAAVPPLDGVPHEEGCTEPWISQLVADFVIARGARRVLETGGFKGATSVYIAKALDRLGHGHLTVCEIDPVRTAMIDHRIWNLGVSLDRAILAIDVLDFLRNTTEKFDLAWVDDCHEAKHVQQELTLLYPKMNHNGLILLHDVFGSCDLKRVVRAFGGYCLDLPRLGPAGGLGIIQVY